jgi:hypothetical protein
MQDTAVTNTSTTPPRITLDETVRDAVQVLGHKELWWVRKYTAHRVPLALAMWLTVLFADARKTNS